MNKALSLAATMEALAQGGDKRIDQAWADHLHVATETPEFFLALTVVYGRFQEVSTQIANSGLGDKAKNLSIQAADALSAYANPARCQQLSRSQLAANVTQIDLLHIAGEALPDEADEGLPFTLEDVCAELESIRTDAHGADLPPDVKRIIEMSLSSLLMVLRAYKAFGPDGAARVYGTVLAELTRVYTHRPPTEAATSKPLLKRLMTTTAKVMRAVVLVGGFVHGVDQIATDAPHIVALLTGSSEAGESVSNDLGEDAGEQPQAPLDGEGAADVA